MPSTSYFASAFEKESIPNSPGQKTHVGSKKRKKAALSDDSETEGQTLSEFSIINFPPDRETFGTSRGPSSHDSTQQYRAAGALAAQGVPGGRFPHQPLVSESQAGKHLDVEELNAELARLKPPIYPSGGHITSNTLDIGGDKTLLRQRHVGVLTAIMHKCLLQGDYIRAGRAWGLLLRTEINAQPLDIRSQGRWGIGAEILLQRNAQIGNMQTKSLNIDALSDLEQETESKAEIATRFSREGFDEAKSYYESLILQYPFRKAAPHAANSLFFYPAMFGLWIYSVQQQQCDALAISSEPHMDGDSNSDTSDQVAARQETAPDERKEVIRRSTLRQAEAIGARLDELMVSPPYSDDAALWKLRGMVALWAGDLSISILIQPPPIRADSGQGGSLLEDEDAEGLDLEERMEAALVRNQYEQSLTAKQAHVGRAKVALENAIRLDGRKGR